MTAEYEVRLSASAARALGNDLPEAVAAAAWEFIDGALRQNPRRVGKRLREPLFPLYAARRGEYRVIYRIVDQVVLIDVVQMIHRRGAHRTN